MRCCFIRTPPAFAGVGEFALPAHHDATSAWDALTRLRGANVPEPLIARMMGGNAARQFAIGVAQFECGKDQRSGVRPARSGAPSGKGSPAAQAGSEPQVSHEIDATIHSHPGGPPALLVGEEMATPLRGGTMSSNPSTSEAILVVKCDLSGEVRP